MENCNARLLHIAQFILWWPFFPLSVDWYYILTKVINIKKMWPNRKNCRKQNLYVRYVLFFESGGERGLMTIYFLFIFTVWGQVFVLLSNVSTFHTKLKSYKDVRVSQLFCGFCFFFSSPLRFFLSCSGCRRRPAVHMLNICECFACLIWFSLPISHNLLLEMGEENRIWPIVRRPERCVSVRELGRWAMISRKFILIGNSWSISSTNEPIFQLDNFIDCFFQFE